MISDRSYVWMARMIVLAGLPEGWVRGEDREIKGKVRRRLHNVSTANYNYGTDS